MKSVNLSYVLATMLALIVIAGSARLTAAAPLKQATDPAAVLTAFEQLIGSPQGVDAALGMFSDNATLKIIPAPQGTSGLWSGRDEIRQGLDYAVAHKVQHTYDGNPQVAGNNVTAFALVTNDAFQRLGVAPVQFQVEAVIENGKITAYTTTITPAEGRRVAAAAAAAQASAGNQPMLPKTGSSMASDLDNWGLLLGTVALAGGLLLLALRRHQHSLLTRR